MKECECFKGSTGWIPDPGREMSQLGLEIGGNVLLSGTIYVFYRRRLRQNHLVAQLGHRDCEFRVFDF